MYIHDSSVEAVDDVLNERNVLDFLNQFLHALAFAEQLVDIEVGMLRFGGSVVLVELFRRNVLQEGVGADMTLLCSARGGSGGSRLENELSGVGSGPAS